MTQAILRVALPLPMRHTFDYLAPADTDITALQPGIRVQVPFGFDRSNKNRGHTGILIAIAETSAWPRNKLKPIQKIVDASPIISAHMLSLLHWASEYYQHPIGEVLKHALPTLLRQGRSSTKRSPTKKSASTPDSTTLPCTQPLILNAAQAEAVLQITDAHERFQPFLLEGVTGSGKTEVYLQAIGKLLDNDQQALILVPEISLTPQMLQRFKQRFAEFVVCLHSGLNPTERASAWLQASTGEARIVIGTRSAIFTPMPKLGLIVVDEEHDLSFKQQEGFRYSARDLAVRRAQLLNIPIVLGSATPSLESVHNLTRKHYAHLLLPERAEAHAELRYHIVDVRKLPMHEGFSPPLLATINHHLQNNGQVLLFLNRRGFAPRLLCHHCGWMAQCTDCDAHYTLHNKPTVLHCHHCDKRRAIPSHCPDCQQEGLIPVGLGTERIEQTLTRYFPDVPCVRIDRDSTRRKGQLQAELDKITDHHYRLLIGTQMLAKGHHFPNLTLVVIMDADATLFSQDFRAPERLAQLLAQVSGRAGRARHAGEVIIQTHYPEHPLLQALVKTGYGEFARLMLTERSQANLPPFSYQALIRAQAKQANQALDFLHHAKEQLASLQEPSIECLGPITASMERRAGYHHAQLLLQSQQRALLQRGLAKLINYLDGMKKTSQVRWSVDVDPQEVF